MIQCNHIRNISNVCGYNNNNVVATEKLNTGGCMDKAVVRFDANKFVHPMFLETGIVPLEMIFEDDNDDREIRDEKENV